MFAGAVSHSLRSSVNFAHTKPIGCIFASMILLVESTTPMHVQVAG
jgi:hypothetical protein